MSAIRDYYDVLGVSRDADDATIKKAFRRLARELHPDVNSHDPQAEEKFKEAAEAYEVLSDPDRRATYDRFGDVSDLNALMDVLERRVALLELLRTALTERDVLVRIGAENDMPALRSVALVAAGYGLPQRALGAVSVIGPLRMDYRHAIASVRDAANQLSSFVAEVYDER